MFFSRVFVTIWVVSQLQGVHIVVSTTAPGSAGQPRASTQPQSLVVTIHAKSCRDQHSVKTSLRSFVETVEAAIERKSVFISTLREIGHTLLQPSWTFRIKKTF